MSDNPGAPQLNRYQRTAVAAALRQLEEALDAVDQVLCGGGSGLLTVTTSDLADDERQHLGELAQEVRAALVGVGAAWGLEPTVRDGRRVMAAAPALAWEGLEDVRPARLARSGPVNPTLQTTLEPALADLIAQTLALLRVVEGQVRERRGAATRDG